jgi:hypothetical protein
MLKKVLYPVLVTGLLGLQTGLQTARGDESDGENNQKLVAKSMNTVISMEKSLQATPQATYEVPQVTPHTYQAQATPRVAAPPQLVTTTFAANTNIYGEYHETNLLYPVTNIICSSVHMDMAHHVNATVEDKGFSVRIRSWAAWNPMAGPLGPIGFSCAFEFEY